MPALPVKKPNWKGWRFVQDLRVINNKVVRLYPIFPNPHILLLAIPINSNYFSLVDLCSTFLQHSSQQRQTISFCLHLGRTPIYMYCFMSQRYTESPIYFSQILKMNLDDLKFLRNFTLIQQVDDLLLCSETVGLSRHFFLIATIALKGA